MDESLYPLSLLAVVIIAFSFYRSNSFKSMLFTLAAGIYIIYSHETGYSVSSYKEEVVESINESATEFSKTRGIKGYDEAKAKKAAE